LRVDRLTVGYRGRSLISDIDLELAPGVVLTLIGPNGSGKSTILKTIAKYLAPLGGAVYIGRHPTDQLRGRDLARRLAVVLTERPRTQLMTCQDVVASGRYPHTGRFGRLTPEDHRQVRQAMELLHAWELREQYFQEVSDGQKQRIMIARALCQQPRVIVLDEPTAYLDVRYKLELLSVLRTLAQDRGITVVMSLHELDLAQKVSDLVLCLDGQGIAGYGPPAEIFTGRRIDQLFGLDHGSFDPLFGSLEFAPPAGTADVFVVAGGGCGVPAYRGLQRRQRAFVTGVLHHGDIDHQVGLKLASEVFATAAFEPIDPAVLDQALARLKTCRALVDCLTGYGAINIGNRRLVEAAAGWGIPVLTRVEDLDQLDGGGPGAVGHSGDGGAAGVGPGRDGDGVAGGVGFGVGVAWGGDAVAGGGVADGVGSGIVGGGAETDGGVADGVGSGIAGSGLVTDGTAVAGVGPGDGDDRIDFDASGGVPAGDR
jgi:iron complex transport system ATP-binding protein